MQCPNAFQNQQLSESAMEVSWLQKTIMEKDHGQQGLRQPAALEPHAAL